MIRDRAGVAVFAAVLLLLVAMGLAHGALLLARAEGVAARSRVAGFSRALSERGAFYRILRQTPHPRLREFGVWDDTTVVDTVSFSDVEVTLTRIGPESWWATTRTVGWIDSGAKDHGRLLWWMDPEERVAALPSVVTVGTGAPVAVDGSIERAGFGFAEPPLTAALCTPTPGSRFAGQTPPAVDSIPTRPGPPRAALGLISFDSLLARSPIGVTGSGTPLPTSDLGTCSVTDPWNWGDPDVPSGPCGPHLAVRAAPSTVRVDGGVGQGVWAVDGDFVLASDARIHGMVFARGALVLEGNAEFHGIAVAEGGLSVAPGARIVASACWAVRGLEAAAPFWSPRPRSVPDVPAPGP